MTVTCPEPFVVLLVDDRLPTVAPQTIVLLTSGLLALSFSVAVSVTEPPELTVKLVGEIERTVDVFGTPVFTVTLLEMLPVAPPLSVIVSEAVYVFAVKY